MTIFDWYILFRATLVLAGVGVLWSIYDNAQVARYRRMGRWIAQRSLEAQGLDIESLRRRP